MRFLVLICAILFNSTAALAGDSVRLSLPKGFCLLDPQKSTTEAGLQRIDKEQRERNPEIETLAEFYECELLKSLRRTESGIFRSIISVGRLRAIEDRVKATVDDPGYHKGYFETLIEGYGDGHASREKYRDFKTKFESSAEFDERRNLGVYSIDKDQMFFSKMAVSGKKADGIFKLTIHLRSYILLGDRLYAIASEILLHKGADFAYFRGVHDDYVESFARSNTSISLAGGSVHLSLPDGFCLVEPDKSEGERKINAHFNKSDPELYENLLARLFECDFIKSLRNKKAKPPFGGYIDIIRYGLRKKEQENENRLREVRDKVFGERSKSYKYLSSGEIGKFSSKSENNNESICYETKQGVVTIDRGMSYITYALLVCDSDSSAMYIFDSDVFSDNGIYKIKSSMLGVPEDATSLMEAHDNFVKSFIRSNRSDNASVD